MRITTTISKQDYTFNLNKGRDISLPIGPGLGPKAWYVNDVVYTPVIHGDFVGDVAKGGAVNFMNVTFNPHGNGTHTECFGHIFQTDLTITEALNPALKTAQLITIEPHMAQDDLRIDVDSFNWDSILEIEALIVRTLPNNFDKRNRNYSGTNPVYFTKEAMESIVASGIKHLLIDLPSVDKEADEGAVAAHHVFWNVPESPQRDKTITELIFVPTDIKDGVYLLDIQIAPFMLDASPSRPILYSQV